MVCNKLCTSCGACGFLAQGKIQYQKTQRTYLPNIITPLSSEEEELIEQVCPAKGYDIIRLADVFKVENYDYRIGYYEKFCALKSTEEKIQAQASSGGVMTALPMYLLKKKIIDGVVATTYQYNGKEVLPQTFIVTKPEDLYKCQGSKYMPIPTLQVLKEVKAFQGKVAYIGTPCQIAAIRNIQQIDAVLKEKIVFCIGNFCGGFRDLREQKALINLSGIKDLTHFQYRGNGQPGYMRIVGDGKEWKYPYPNYGKLTGYLKKYRCRVCVDATAELADIACGDAWIPEFRNKGWSLVIIRNKDLLPIIEEMLSQGLLSKKSVTLEQLVASQRGNLTSKKERYLSRRKLFKLLRKPLPEYDGGWNEQCRYSMAFEAKVYCSEIFKYVMYKLHLLKYIRK